MRALLGADTTPFTIVKIDTGDRSVPYPDRAVRAVNPADLAIDTLLPIPYRTKRTPAPGMVFFGVTGIGNYPADRDLSPALGA
jgi:hypothetical protein